MVCVLRHRRTHCGISVIYIFANIQSIFGSKIHHPMENHMGVTRSCHNSGSNGSNGNHGQKPTTKSIMGKYGTWLHNDIHIMWLFCMGCYHLSPVLSYFWNSFLDPCINGIDGLLFSHDFVLPVSHGHFPFV